MSVKRNNPQSGKTGRYVKKEVAANDKDGTFVTETTISKKKFKEAEEMLEQLEKPSPQASNVVQQAYKTMLQWLIKNGEKPKVS